MKVALVSLFNIRSFPIRTLEACLANKGIETASIYFKDATLEGMPFFSGHELHEMCQLILSKSPDLIGISLRSTFFQHAIQLTSFLKKQSNVPIVWGGTHAIVCPDECIKYADIVCIGEGENTIVDICERISNKESLDGVENIFFKKGTTIIKNGLGPLVSNLDKIPSGIIGTNNRAEKIFYDGTEIIFEDPMVAQNIKFYDFLSARGCPFSCSYCSNSYFKRRFKDRGSYIRKRSVDNVIGELENAKNSFPLLNLVGANDEIFGMDDKWLGEFCEKYKQKIGIPFHCDMHPAYIDDNVIKSLKFIGLQSMSIGVQSAMDSVRRERYCRNTSDEMLEDAVMLLSKYDVRIHYDFIFDDPLAVDEEYDRCVEWLLCKPRPFYVAMYSMQYAPKTDYTERLLKDGIINENCIDGSNTKGLFEWRVSYKVEGRSKHREMMLKIIELFNGLFFVQNGKRRYVNIVPSWLIALLYEMTKKTSLKGISLFLIDKIHNFVRVGTSFLFVISHFRLMKLVRSRLFSLLA